MTQQAPIPSGFGMRSSARDVLSGVDLSSKIAIVTGGYSGLGLETTKALAAAGAAVTVPARSLEKAHAALDGVDGVAIESLDLAVPDAISAFAEDWRARNPALHILINNAAIMANPLTRDARGYESQFATNHLGHFALTALLWPALKAADGARVVSLSSIGHRISPVVFDDWNFTSRTYDKWAAYGQAKTANSLFAIGLDARAQGHGVRAFAVHPGGIMTDLQRHLPRDEQIAMGWIDEDGRINEQFKTPEQGAATSVWCATSPQLTGRGGVYCEDCDIAATVQPGDKAWVGVRPHAIDPASADRLWGLSEALTGVRFSL
jgi:NAD(P)-dependent dehydrogenase (short-subunit alcohol dehydrogenase family)